MKAKLRALLRRDGGETLEAQADAAFARQDFAAALALTHRLAEQGNDAAFYRLGEMFEHGLGLLQDFAQALHWYERAADAGRVDAWAKLGDFYLAGRGSRTADGSDADRLLGLLSVQPDYDKAAHWNGKAAGAGIAAAQARLGFQYVQGLGLARDVAAAERLWLAAARAGEVPGQRWLGMLYAGDETGEARPAEAARWFRAAAQAGDATACVGLATLNLEGAVPGGGAAEAFDLLSRAAEGGHVGAMTMLGGLCRDGRGTARNIGAAETWFRRASARGDRDAVLLLGLLLTDALEPPDPVSGAATFREAAEYGYPLAHYRLGLLYLSGQGVAEDAEKAFRWIEKAARLGSADACLHLGVMYAQGQGVEQDYALAAHWYGRAAELGSSDGLFNLAFLRLRGLDPAPVDERDGVALLEEAAALGNRAALWALHNVHREGTYGNRDAARANHWLRAAAKQGESEAQVQLALMLRGGIIIPLEGEATFGLMQAAADAGHPFAQAWLGDVLATGDGVESDEVLARAWYEKAAAQGHEGARAMLERCALPQP